MKFTETKIPGAYIVEPDAFPDNRGIFVKTFHKDTFEKEKIHFNLEESFYSMNKKGVIRGMHFQIPPHDHAKIVYVPAGSILDVILDIRKGSPTYGEYVTVELSDINHTMVYIPTGCAHGFLSLADNSCMVYLQSTMRAAEHERGIHVHSFGMQWDADQPILSKRDQEFPALKDFDSPFIYKHLNG